MYRFAEVPMLKGFIFSFVLVGTACTSVARPDLNAFLNKRSVSVTELVAQVKSDKAVMDRYCRHYSMTPSEVVQHLKTLHVSKLKRTDLYVIFSVPVGGALKSHLQTLRAGTPVFASASGMPELLIKCGNPLTRGPKKPEMANSIAATIVAEEVVDPQVIPVEAVAVIETEEPSQPAIIPSIASVPDAPVTPDQTAIGEQGTSDIPIITVPANSFNPLALLLLPAVGVTINRHETGQPVPEPASLAGMGMGAAALVAYRRRRAKK